MHGKVKECVCKSPFTPTKNSDLGRTPLAHPHFSQDCLIKIIQMQLPLLPTLPKLGIRRGWLLDPPRIIKLLFLPAPGFKWTRKYSLGFNLTLLFAEIPAPMTRTATAPVFTNTTFLKGKLLFSSTYQGIH